LPGLKVLVKMVTTQRRTYRWRSRNESDNTIYYWYVWMHFHKQQLNITLINYFQLIASL